MCEYYCIARGIPIANILEIALGTNTSYCSVPGRDVYTYIYLPLLQRITSLQAQAVLLGPGTPILIELDLYTYTAGTYVKGGVGYPALCGLAGSSRHLSTLGYNNTNVVVGCTPSSAGGWSCLSITNLTVGLPLNGKTAAGWSAQIGSSTPWTDLFGNEPFINPDTSTTISGSSTWRPVRALGTKETSESFPLYQATGKVGVGNGWTGTPQIETEAYCKNLIDTATKYDRGNTLSSVLKKPIIVGLSSVLGWDINDQFCLVSYLRHIGFTNVKWYHSGLTTPSVSFDNVQDTPLYPASTVINNALVDVEVAALFGDIGNDNMATNNDAGADARINFYKPVLGAVAALSPSYGFNWGVNLLRRSGEGVMSLTNTRHITGAHTYQHGWYIYNLLAGLSGLEACYYTEWVFDYIWPAGDPLYRPFPHRAEPLGETGQMRTSWRKYLPTQKSFKG